jgi:SAM-dependent MidA family methyltransferase
MNAFQSELRQIIAAEGPISVARYMALCLTHPVHGYYATRDPLGTQGDFVTAPEISQMFGELIGVWAGAVWQYIDSPGSLRLVELGPGRGTLMADALRAAAIIPGFLDAVSVHLVEISPPLRKRQEEMLMGRGVPVVWHNDFSEVPPGPIVVIANEFIDALPVHQAVRMADGWHERMVGLDDEGKLVYALHGEPVRGLEGLLPPHIRAAPIGAIYEWRSDRVPTDLTKRLLRSAGAALIIDYGHLYSDIGETLQALSRHGFADPLEKPGEADLTAHVDFAALTRAVQNAGAGVQGPLTQAEFLRRLGIDERARALKTRATPAQAADIDKALARLTESGPTGMGELFKVLAIADPMLGSLPGFET